jgi:predicted DNA-binding transcriptional regulator AlpA
MPAGVPSSGRSEEGGRQGAQARTVLAAFERARWIEESGDVGLLVDVLETLARTACRVAERIDTLWHAEKAPPAPVAPLAPAPADRWLTVTELAALMHVSKSWVHHQPPDTIPGRIQHTPNGNVRWSEQAVRAWMAQGCPPLGQK